MQRPANSQEDVFGVDTARAAAGAAGAARPELGGRLAGLSLPRQVLVLAIWPFLEQVLNFLVGFVDIALAGRLPVERESVAAVNALGVAGYIGWLLNLMQMAVGVGAAAIVARAVGGRHRRLANAALGQSLLLALLWGMVLGAAVFALARPIGGFTALSGLDLSYCVTYLRIIAAAAPLAAVLLVGNACLRASGDTRSPFAVMTAVNLVNAGTSVLLVWGPPPLGGHGVAGIAAGTAIAWAVGAAAILAVLLRGGLRRRQRGELRLHLHRLRPHARTLRRIVRVGLPNLLETSGMWVGNFMVVMVVGMIGAAFAVPALGAHMIAVRLEAISYLPGFAIGTAAATLTGQYLGLGDPHRAREAVKLCWKLAGAVMFVLGLLLIALPHALTALVTDKAPLLAAAPPVLRMSGFVQVFFATYIVLAQAMRGAGDTRAVMGLTYGSTFLVRVPGAYLLGVVFGLGLQGVWLALCAELALRGILFAARFHHGGWLRAKV